ncbi:MAG TPA: hypothetical protein HA252_03745, partial [Candidatus Diapherotrites archaeon]|nr:hypothetical protein [Candidatus Diapherotrites archaeon]
MARLLSNFKGWAGALRATQLIAHAHPATWVAVGIGHMLRATGKGIAWSADKIGVAKPIQAAGKAVAAKFAPAAKWFKTAQDWKTVNTAWKAFRAAKGAKAGAVAAVRVAGKFGAFATTKTGSVLVKAVPFVGWALAAGEVIQQGIAWWQFSSEANDLIAGLKGGRGNQVEVAASYGVNAGNAYLIIHPGLRPLEKEPSMPLNDEDATVFSGNTVLFQAGAKEAEKLGRTLYYTFSGRPYAADPGYLD